MSAVADAVVDKLTDPRTQDKLRRTALETHIEQQKNALKVGWVNLDDLIQKATEKLIAATDISASLLDPLARGAINSLLSEHESGRHVGPNAGATLIAKVSGSRAAIEPGIEGAARYATLMLHEQTEAWLRGVIVELITEFMPRLMPFGGGVETVQKFQEIVESALGGGRMMRRILQPFVQATAITPAQWHVNKQYRPELLGPAEVARQVARGKMDLDAAHEELARQGWSEERIEALLSNQQKRLGIDDLFYEVHANLIPLSEAIETLREQGYDEQTASKEINIRILKRLDAVRNDVVGVALNAYVNRQIGKAELLDALEIGLDSPAERREYVRVAETRRALNQRELSSGEARRLVVRGILATPDYRRALERDGYVPEAIAALDLELRDELAAVHDLAERRAAAEAAKAAARAERDAEATARRDELERRRALDRRGDENTLEAAAVRGLVPIARVEELYRARYDDETAGIYVALLEERRGAYLEEQRRRDDTVKRAAGRGLSIADLESAVLANVLDFGRYESRLATLGFAPEDVDLLVRTLRATKDARDAAQAARDRAVTTARGRSIDLGRYERLVRRGLRTSAQYAALLASLGFDDGSIAGMRELLELQMADDAAASQARANAEARLSSKGLSLAELRRLVLGGFAPASQYEALLVAQGFTADAIQLLMAELGQAVADADAARQRRTTAAADVDTRALSLDSAARAVRLGLISPAAYAAQLAAAGFSPDDAAFELDVAREERAATAATQQARAAAPLPPGDKGLTLAQLARAVKAELKTLADFRARAVELGFGPDAVDTQVRLLALELQETQAAKARREQLGAELAGGGNSLAELEAAVRGGSLTLAGYVERLQLSGLTPADAELLAGLLELTLGA